MPETITKDRRERDMWKWTSIHHDLVQQGGLQSEDLFIDPSSVQDDISRGSYRDRPFLYTWEIGHYIMLSTLPQDRRVHEELAAAFSNVAGYSPFVRYRNPENGLVTTEWRKTGVEQRYEVLQAKGKKDITFLLH